MENEHELSYETLTRVYLGSYEHYKGVVAEVEHSKPGFELQGSKMVETGHIVADEAVNEEMYDSVERAATTASSLKAEQDIGNINRTHSTAIPNVPLPQGIGSGGRPRRQETMGDRPAQTSSCLGDNKDCSSKGDCYFEEKSQEAGKKEEVKNSRDEFIQDCSILKDNDFDEEFDANMDEAFEQVYDANKDTNEEGEVQVSTVDMEVNTATITVNTASTPVTTAGVSVSNTGENITTAKPSTPPPPTTTVIEDEDLTITQTLVKMRSEKSKVRGVIMKEPSKTATRPTVPPQQHDPKDKRKAKMVKPEKPLKRKAQIKFDEEVAQRLQAQMQDKLE
ncbi:hypothetical protein Tco_0321319 [Tanacetum coccineum]